MTPTGVSSIDRFLVIFPSIVYEALPFIIIGALVSGILEEMLPHKTFARLIPKQRWLAVAGSALLGLIFPMCECGIVPVMRRLLGKGLPLSCAVAYMLAAPVINPVVIASTWAAFSGDRSVESGGDGLTSIQMVSLRVGLAYIVAVAVGLIVDRRQKSISIAYLVQPMVSSRLARLHEHEHEHEHSPGEHHHHDGCGHEHSHEHSEHEHKHEHPAPPGAALALAPVEAPHSHAGPPRPPRPPWTQRLMNISETSLRDFIDITCFLILGAILAAAVQTFRIMDAASGVTSNPLLAAPVMMALAIILCLCSEADAFVAANLIAIPLAGKIAFLVLGPMLDLKLYLMYTRVFRTRLIWTIIPSVVVLVLILSLATHYAFELWK